MIIRDANLNDSSQLLELGIKMHAESPRFSQFSFDSGKTLNLINNLIMMQMGITVVVVDGEKIVGMMGGMVLEHFFSKDLHACEYVVFMDKEYRFGGAAIKMIREFEKRAIALGAKEISLGISTELFTERTQALYEKLGYKLSGVSTIKRIE